MTEPDFITQKKRDILASALNLARIQAFHYRIDDGGARVTCDPTDDWCRAYRSRIESSARAWLSFLAQGDCTPPKE